MNSVGTDCYFGNVSGGIVTLFLHCFTGLFVYCLTREDLGFLVWNIVLLLFCRLLLNGDCF